MSDADAVLADLAATLGGSEHEAGERRRYLVVADADGLEEALLAKRQRDEVAELDELRLGEVLVQAAPERIVGQSRVPGDGHRPGQGRALAVVEAPRRLEVQDVVDLRLGGALLPGQHGTLAAAVLAVHGLGDVEPAQFLDRVVGHALAEEDLPGIVECLHDRRVVQPDRLALRPRSAEPARALHDRHELGIGDGGRVDVTDVWHCYSWLESLVGPKPSFIPAR